MIEVGTLILLQPGEIVVRDDEDVFTAENIRLIQQVIANVALCPQAYKLGALLAEYFGELDDDEYSRFTIDKDGMGELAVIPATPERE